MYTYTYSFQPDGKYFVFCCETGRTMARDFDSIRGARTYIVAREEYNAEREVANRVFSEGRVRAPQLGYRSFVNV